MNLTFISKLWNRKDCNLLISRNMELKEFVKETLIQIVDGVQEAQRGIKGLNSVINPKILIERGSRGEKYDSKTYTVDFEVVLTRGDAEGNNIGIGVLFGAITIGGKTKAATEKVSATSVRFSVPIKYTKDEDV
ncbi:hypothetical protein EZS27_027505 [termite gut metagenome]|uniref:Uncharacterized protein n=1 Tax=termite gut metagenome TaxID=433724 RepID=A0A5J4QPG5_9ZZZZ